LIYNVSIVKVLLKLHLPIDTFFFFISLRYKKEVTDALPKEGLISSIKI